MNYATIKKNDIANGTGVRVSLFVSGCRHRCKNCFNREAWDFGYGLPYTDETERDILDALDHSYVAGLSLLGGEPFEPENRAALIALLRAFSKRFPDKTVWCYTGFTFEELMSETGERGASAHDMLSMIDVLVDGRFVEEQQDLSLLFRGSANQRILNAKRSLVEKMPVLMEGVWKRTMGSGNIEED